MFNSYLFYIKILKISLNEKIFNIVNYFYYIYNIKLSNMGYYITDKGDKVHLKNVKEVYLFNLNIIKLNLSNNTKLENLSCFNNRLTYLDVSKNINLK